MLHPVCSWIELSHHVVIQGETHSGVTEMVGRVGASDSKLSKLKFTWVSDLDKLDQPLGGCLLSTHQTVSIKLQYIEDLGSYWQCLINKIKIVIKMAAK